MDNSTHTARRIDELVANGYIGMSIPERFGGLGLNIYDWGQRLKALGYEDIDLSVPLLISLRSSVTLALASAERPIWLERYVKPMLAGAIKGAFAYTERNDIFSLKSALSTDGDGFRLTGEKLFVTGGQDADVFLTYATSPGGDVRVAVVDSHSPGVEIIPVSGSGFAGARFAKVRFERVAISRDQLIENMDGISHAQYFLNSRRILLVAGVVGRMQAVLESCVAYGLDTVRYEKALSKLPNFQVGLGKLFAIARNAEKLLAAGLTLQTRSGHEAYWDADISGTKWAITEWAQQFALIAMRLSGGTGFESDHPVACFHRDVAGLIAGGGAQEVLEMDMGVFATHLYCEDKR